MLCIYTLLIVRESNKTFETDLFALVSDLINWSEIKEKSLNLDFKITNRLRAS